MPSMLLKEPAGMAELRAQIAELKLEEAAYAGRASSKRPAAWHVLYNVVHICNMPRVRKRHLSYDAVRISICPSARQLSCQQALLGLAERA
jgi:hypothetical protein